MRLGILISSFMTALLSLALIYSSVSFLSKSNLSYLGLLTGLVLLILAVAVLLGKGIARRILSIFYMFLSMVGILLTFGLPPEGLLIFLPSLAIGTYLWRYRENEGSSIALEDLEGTESSILFEEENEGSC